jgi:hypothetical protein
MTKYIRIPGTFIGNDTLIPVDRIVSLEPFANTPNNILTVKLDGTNGFQSVTFIFAEFNQDVSEYSMQLWLMNNAQRALVSNWTTNIFEATEPPCAITGLSIS